MGGVISPYASGLPLSGGTITGNLTVNGNLNASGADISSAVGFGGNYVPVVNTAPVTVTGVTALTLLAQGITIPAGGLAAGQLYRVGVWGNVTTTLATQTVQLGLYFGGIGGTAILQYVAQQPSTTLAVTAAAWLAEFEMTALSATSVAVKGWDGLNYFFTALTDGATTVSNAASAQLVVGVVPSATAVSVTATSSYCCRIA